MKKALSLLLVVFMLVTLLASCDAPIGDLVGNLTGDLAGDVTGDVTGNGATEIPVTGITKEEWQEAISEEKFDNITIVYTIKYDEQYTEMLNGMTEVVQTVKICDDQVYRTLGESLCAYFTDEEAVSQRGMFLEVFLALLAEKDNYVYDAESKSYVAPEKISVTLNLDGNRTDLVEMDNGVVKFDEKGRLVSFTCTLKETVTTPTTDGQTQTVTAPVCDSIWTFTDYGSTVITEDEIAAAIDMSDDGSDAEVEVPAE